MLTALVPIWARWLVLLAFGLACFVWGDAHRAKVDSSKALALQLKQQQAYSQALADSQVKGDKLTTALLVSQRSNAKLTREKADAINRLTDNRICLGAPILGLLNSTNPDGSLPQTPGTADAKGGLGASATDRDVANWAIDARSKYHDCAAQLNALIDFVK
jgi:prophage endopeptidase